MIARFCSVPRVPQSLPTHVRYLSQEGREGRLGRHVEYCGENEDTQGEYWRTICNVLSEGNLHQTFRRLKGEMVRVVWRLAKKQTIVIIHLLAHLGFVKS